MSGNFYLRAHASFVDLLKIVIFNEGPDFPVRATSSVAPTLSVWPNMKFDLLSVMLLNENWSGIRIKLNMHS
jgi:hypothetical protein